MSGEQKEDSGDSLPPGTKKGITQCNFTVTEMKQLGYIAMPETETPYPEEGSPFGVIILGTKLVKEAKGKKSFTTYRLRVADQNGLSWETLHRYSECLTLKENLKAAFPGEPMAKFPPKKIIGNMTPENIDARHQMLGAWFRSILRSEKMATSELVEDFLTGIKYQENIDDIVQLEDGQIFIKVDLGKMGYLYKLKNGRFKQFWAVLRDNVLYKYKSHTDRHPYGQIVFTLCDVTEAEFNEPGAELTVFCFMVVTEKKKMIFATDTEQDTEEWVDSLAEATYPLDE